MSKGRPKYRVTENDAIYVYGWLKNQIQSQAYAKGNDFLSHPLAQAPSERDRWLHQWIDDWTQGDEPKETLASTLNAQCETWLTSTDWKRLKQTLRKNRQRQRGTGQLKTISLSPDALYILHEIQRQDPEAATYDDLVIKYLQPILQAKVTQRLKDEKKL